MYAEPLITKARVLDQLSALLAERRALEVRRYVAYYRLAQRVLDANESRCVPQARMRPARESMRGAA
jgi:hypothetical protein